MPYVKENCVAGKTIEVSVYYTYRCHASGMRRKKREETPPAQKEVNRRRAEKELRRMMNANFQDGDYLATLTYRKGASPSGSVEMQKDIASCIRTIGRKLKKLGMDPMKYIYVKEVGPRGARHIHMMLSEIPMEILRESWPHGGIHVDLLYTDGQYAQIAKYFIKYSKKTEEIEGKLIGKRWYCSTNLERPVPTKQYMLANQFRKTIREKEGYYIDKNSVQNYICNYSGYEHLAYTYIRLEDKNGRTLRREAKGTRSCRTG